MQAPVLDRPFYERPTIEVALSLLGKIIVHGACAGRIVEVEAYLGESDPAAHAARGLTPRTRVLYGPPGHAYVYFIYGLHECLNLVAEPEGSPGCVLIRALEPLAGIDQMRERRGMERLVDLMSGPAKLTKAMGITRELNGLDVTRGTFTVRDDGAQVGEIEATPRIGIGQAADWELRFLVRGSRWASRQPPKPDQGGRWAPRDGTSRTGTGPSD
ncbi:MAG: DNA-3-methyladenine glycosylase [Acidobacteria bacterium]|nr:DNA-3-methyladenine glycosylase [Acidobacteriota bacterium]